jgi:hypothetical protein
MFTFKKKRFKNKKDMRNNKEYTVFFLTYHLSHSVFCYEFRLDGEYLIPKIEQNIKIKTKG